MSEMPVTGPHRIYVRHSLAGVEVDVSDFASHLLRELALLFAEDPEGFAEELSEIAGLNVSAQHQGNDSYALHEQDARVDELLEKLGGGSMPVYGRQVPALIDSLRRSGAHVRAVPAQQDRRAS